jgi:pimeloyl-ACP methyl ester carboxylesterase
MSSTRRILIFASLIGSLIALHAPCRAQSSDTPQTAEITESESRIDRDSDQDIQLWYGVLKTTDREFRFVIELTPTEAPSSGSLKSLDEGNQIFDLKEVTIRDRTLKFALPASKASYEGALDQTGTRATGHWKQRGTKLPLSLTKVTKVPQPDIRVVFSGTVNGLLQKIKVSFVELETGKVYFNSVSQKAGGFVASKEVNKDGGITFRVPAVQGTFQGRYQNEARTKLKGKWTQGLVSLDLELTLQKGPAENLNMGANKVSRPQTPRAPFPYKVEQVKVEVPNGDVTLAGTLTIPEGEIKSAMVLVSGSGPQDRDETIFEHKPFWVIADHFARNGIATLRYDDRGVGNSTGKFSTATSYDLAKDAEAAFNFLSRRSEVQDSLVGICGHSEGGLLGPMIAARNAKVGFLILLAAPGVNGLEIILSQGPLLMRAQGISAADIAKQHAIQKVVLGIIRENQENEVDLLASRLRETLGDDLDKTPQLVQTVQAGLIHQATPWLKEFLKLDPKVAFARVKCPVLAINGSKDLQVDPVLNLPVIRDTLRQSGNHNVEIAVYPGLNHLFQSCRTGLPVEYGDIEETFNAAPLQRMTSWTLAQSVETP